MSGNKHDFGHYAGILGLHCYLTFNYILKEPNEGKKHLTSKWIQVNDRSSLVRDSHQTKIHFKVPCPCLAALSLPSIQGCIPTQALIIREVSISNPTDPWLASRHQPMG